MEVHYEIVCDGGAEGNGSESANAYGSYRIKTMDGREFMTTIHFERGTTNNEAEYRTLIAALEDLLSRLRDAGANSKLFNVHIISDSQVMLYQINKGDWLPRYKCKAPNLIPLRDEVRAQLGQFRAIKLEWVRREFIVGVLGH